MKELFENDDEILGLVRKKGLLKPLPDFTSRVMKSIEEAKEPVIYKPLLSKKAWALLVAGFILAIGLCWYALSDSNSGSLYDLGNLTDRIGTYFSRFEFSLKLDSHALLIITLAIISMGVLLSLDLWLSNNRREIQSD